MNEETTASKVSRLLQKSRQAFRIYSSMSKSAKAEHNECADMQAIEWRNINADLVRQLTLIIEKYSARNLSLQIAQMRDLLLSDYRRIEAELNTEHREVIACTQRGDFIRVAQLARVLISKKAFVQAAQAACHELSLIIDDQGKTAGQNTKYSPNILGMNNVQQENTVQRENTAQQDLMSQGLKSERDLPVTSSTTKVPGASLIQQNETEAFSFDEEFERRPRMAKVIPLRR